VLIVNSPSNPTGAVMNEHLSRELVELAAASGVLVVSDEVYDEVVYDGRHVNLAAFDPVNVISVFSFSKTYAMTGWRVGYASFPSWLADTVAKLQEAFLSSLPTVSQAAALAALAGDQAAVRVNLDAYRAGRDAALSRLAHAGLRPVAPRGAFYLMAPLAPGVDSRRAAIDLVGHGVAVAPGSAFGAQAASMVRISLASEPAQLTLGLERFVEWWAATDGGLRLGSGDVSGLSARLPRETRM
jgi:aspartate/methionine/tyrosine aminotransferase